MASSKNRQDRKQRLAEALRANLKRRKEQARTQREAAKDIDPTQNHSKEENSNFDG